MSLPIWALGEDCDAREAADSYIVHLHSPLFVVRITQKRGCKLMLTHTGSPKDLEPGGCTPFDLLHQAARFWASQVNDPDYAKQPPEILSRSDFKPPKFLLCDSPDGSRTFLVHTPPPLFAAEFVGDHWLPGAGERGHPLVPQILTQAEPPLF